MCTNHIIIVRKVAKQSLKHLNESQLVFFKSGSRVLKGPFPKEKWFHVLKVLKLKFFMKPLPVALHAILVLYGDALQKYDVWKYIHFHHIC